MRQQLTLITDRIFLASYTHPPDENTPFPWPTKSQRSPTKRGTSRPQEADEDTLRGPPEYFSIDKELLYNAFHADFGPLHIGHLYRFAVLLHDVLGAAEAQKRPIVFWSNADARSRANAACILACYMVIIQSWPPHLALAPIAQMDPPCMPFRDAGYSQADYGLTIQDVVYGVWKAKEEKLCTISGFDLGEYEKFERVDMGDFNWISPSFVAFASPQSKVNAPITPDHHLYNTLPRTIADVRKSTTLSKPFKNVLEHFSERNVGLVVRLNSELYSPSYFTALGIKHLDMIFDDGTCPSLTMVRKFINLAHDMITQRKKGIAVHCKAGLGRTGCLIGAYLIYRHGFTANEVIAFMRFMRPGMVVGPQQHWLHLNQGTFREWWFEDSMKEKLAAMAPTTPTKANSVRQKLSSNGQAFTPPQRDSSYRRSALGEITHNEQASLGSSIGVQDENLPAPTPGQPRKTNKIYGQGSPYRKAYKPDENLRPDSQSVSVHQTTLHEADESDDYAMQLLSSARQASRSPPSRSGKRRAVSCTTTTMTTTKWDVEGSDIENQDVLMEPEEFGDSVGLKERKPKTPSSKSGSGMGSLMVSKRSPSRRSTEGKTSVRKTSGRVGSVGSTATRSRAS
ncbi:phosphatases II [Myriangium duriaei CBS 260.36]|uniref:protein-tyrosine-phosphatase n=1 Tax=Myriangium duriaei CBS 260.36 TaxID=1168546 RepID=A0A9P4MIY2_9PEZI|nr:phosphatases II [Myriangium duriaei CBS 260.36]